jgi:hypothetical protein
VNPGSPPQICPQLWIAEVCDPTQFGGKCRSAPSPRTPETGDVGNPMDGEGRVNLSGKSLFAVWGKTRNKPREQQERTRLYSSGTPMPRDR